MEILNRRKKIKRERIYISNQKIINTNRYYRTLEKKTLIIQILKIICNIRNLESNQPLINYFRRPML